MLKNYTLGRKVKLARTEILWYDEKKHGCNLFYVEEESHALYQSVSIPSGRAPFGGGR